MKPIRWIRYSGMEKLNNQSLLQCSKASPCRNNRDRELHRRHFFRKRVRPICLQYPLHAFACIFMCSILSSCNAVTILHVSSNGADSNPGTEVAPFLTIGKADSVALPGDRIEVGAGTYQVSAPLSNSSGIRTKASGTASRRIKFFSNTKDRAKIIMSGSGTAWNSKGDYVDIEGFDISGSGRIGILASGKELRLANNFVHDLTISGGCTGAGGAAIDTNGPLGNVVIENNVIRNIGKSMIGKCNTIHGIYIANSNNFVRNNIVSGVAAVGIQQWHGATASTIINNTVFQCKIGILIGQGDSGQTEKGSSDNYVANNVVYDNMTYGIVEGGVVGRNNRYVNNLSYRNQTNIRVKGLVKGTISADPEFIDYEKNGLGDYRLRANSPAVGIGSGITNIGLEEKL